MSSKLTPEKAALERAANVLGGQAALADVLGFPDRRHVWPWFGTDRRVPAEHCPAIERATREKGSVVKCEELRPDVAWGVLRGDEKSADTTPAPAAAHPRRATLRLKHRHEHTPHDKPSP